MYKNNWFHKISAKRGIPRRLPYQDVVPKDVFDLYHNTKRMNQIRKDFADLSATPEEYPVDSALVTKALEYLSNLISSVDFLDYNVHNAQTIVDLAIKLVITRDLSRSQKHGIYGLLAVKLIKYISYEIDDDKAILKILDHIKSSIWNQGG